MDMVTGKAEDPGVKQQNKEGKGEETVRAEPTQALPLTES